VVPTHARPELLAECVGSLVAAMGVDDELIVADCCAAGAAPLTDAPDPRVRHVHGPHAGKCAKLNEAMRIATGDVVLITDDDCRVPVDWVDALVAPFEDPAVGVVFGPSEGLSRTAGEAPPPPLDPGPAPPEIWNYAHGLSMAVRRTAVVDVGGFDERLGPGAAVHGEEGDLVLRLADRGWTCAIAGGLPVQHLEWRSPAETAENVLVYQRGAGAYLGAAMRRSPRTAWKPALLRIAHERGRWRPSSSTALITRLRLLAGFVGGILAGLRLAPERFIEPATHPPARSLRPRVLWVTAEAPDRNQGGGNIRQAMLLDEVRRHLDVTLLLVGELRDDVVRSAVERTIELRAPRRRAAEPDLRRRVRDLWRVLVNRRPSEVDENRRVRRVLEPVVTRLAEDHDVVMIQHLALADLVQGDHGRARWFLHVFDVASRRAEHELATETGTRQRWLLTKEAANAARYEARMTKAFDGLVVVSDADAQALRSARHHLVPNGVDPDAFATTPLPSEPRLLLPATLDYRPNVLGAQWFCDEVLPLVREAVPDVRFALVGRHPVTEITRLADRPGVEVHADVPAMAPWLEWSRVVLVPLWIGTGTRLKALEAMAAARPVVGTTIGLEGLAIADGVHARVVDDPRKMADAIVELLRDDAAAAAFASAGRAHVVTHFSWTAIANRLVDAIRPTPDHEG
jgi:glycosyltransferase involved in cell wall biosynthesis/GT2 family glycosyltransferase